MKNQKPGETQEAYLARITGEYKEQRSSVGKPVLNDQDVDLIAYLAEMMGGSPIENHRLNSRGQKADIIPMRFIQPGLVHYDDVGTVLVEKEALDKMAQTFVGKPVFNKEHRSVTDKDFTNGDADGVVTRVWFNPGDGWYWCDTAIWDPETKNDIRNGSSLSCAYDVPKEAWGAGGIHNNIPYDREVMNGEYTHLAIVPNPRYERAQIVYNNQGGRMKLKLWQLITGKKPEDITPSEVELTNATKLVIGDKEIPLDKVVSEYAAAQEREENAALLNALKDDDEVEIRGKKVKVSELKAFAAKGIANASDDDMDKDHKDEKHKDKSVDNCKMCNAAKTSKNEEDEAEKKKKDKEKKEADEMDNSHKAGAHKAAALENCVGCKEDAFQALQNAGHSRPGKFEAPQLDDLKDRVAEGAKRYGAK